jgi:hypothetical protein
MGRTATEILDRFGPSAAPITHEREREPGLEAIHQLSKAPGAISRLSRSTSSGAISRQSSGWYFSSLFGLPLLTRSQAPLEPDATLLTQQSRDTRR